MKYECATVSSRGGNEDQSWLLFQACPIVITGASCYLFHKEGMYSDDALLCMILLLLDKLEM